MNGLRIHLLLVVMTGSAEAQNLPSLAQLRASYEAATKKARDTYAVKRNTVSRSYTSGLTSLEQRYRRANDAAGVRAVELERLRFRRSLDLRPEHQVAEPPGLATLQRNMLTTLSPERKRMQARLDAAAKKYLSNLGKLKVALTRQQRLEEAIAAAEEIKRFNRSSYDLSAPLRKELVLHYGFDAAPEGEVKDKSGAGHDGSPGGAAWTRQGFIGGGLKPGTTLPSLQTHYAPGSQATVSLWMQPAETMNEATPDTPLLIVEGRNAIFRFNWGKTGAGAGHADGAIDLCITPYSSRYAVASTQTRTWEAGTWYHLVASWNGERMRLYVNGLSEADVVQGANNPFNPIVLGHSFKGIVDELMVWERVLTPEEVARLYGDMAGP